MKSEDKQGVEPGSHPSVANRDGAPETPTGHLLVVDDKRSNLDMFSHLFRQYGYSVCTAESGRQALELIKTEPVDLVILDVVMPEMSGFEVCRRIREDDSTRLLPIIMVTAFDTGEEHIKGIDAGADDFITKPINHAELMARARSLLRIKKYHDTIQAQAAQLAELNRILEGRVVHFKRFFSPQLAELIASTAGEDLLKSHRREITVVFLDLRGFTAFSESAEPEEVMELLRSYHEEMGNLINKFEGTLEHFAGDGIMVFFNAPIPCGDHTERAVRMSLEMCARVKELRVGWLRKGYDLDLGVGLAAGYATLGNIGSEGRIDYGAVGNVKNLAARLSAEAKGGQILTNQKTLGKIEGLVEAEPLQEVHLKGFGRPVMAFNIAKLKG